jgi:hypothetical protein
MEENEDDDALMYLSLKPTDPLLRLKRQLLSMNDQALAVKFEVARQYYTDEAKRMFACARVMVAESKELMSVSDNVNQRSDSISLVFSKCSVC